MGTPKAALEWHGSTLLRRTVGIVARATAGPVVVVRATGQDLPSLPADTIVVDDPREGKGPVQGIAAGLTALAGQADTAFVTSTDLPFLHPAFVGRVLRVLSAPGDGPESRCRSPAATSSPWPPPTAPASPSSPSASSRKTGCAPRSCSPSADVERLDDATLLADPALAKLDPDLDSVLNVNTPDDYQAARLRPAPEVTVQLFGALVKAGRPAGPRTVRAATVQAAADATGLPFDRHVTAALNGDQITRDPLVPLASGDTVFFMSADAGG